MNAPVHLLTDLLAYPKKGKIVSRQPTFGWIINGVEAGEEQRAFQIRISLHEPAGGEEKVFWDSGRTESKESLHHLSPLLEWNQAYEWSVRVWNQAGIASPWAEPQRFTPVPDDEAVSAYHLETRRFKPHQLTFDRERSVWCAEFLKHAFGWLEITLPAGTPPCTVTVHVGEKVDCGFIDRHPPGSVRYAVSEVELVPGKATRVPWPANQRNTGPNAIHLPDWAGVVLPFRYVEIEGIPDAEPGLEFVRLQTPFSEEAATFRSSNPDLNQLWEFCHYSVLATTFAGYYIDGDRERIPYEADAYINQLSHYACDCEFSLARRTHEYLLDHPTWPTEWKQFSILIAWADYEATGDPRSLSRCYDRLRAEKLLLEHARPDGLLDTGSLRDIIDWPRCERDGYDFRPVNTVVNAFHYATLLRMQAIAEALGKREHAQEYSGRATQVREAFLAKFWDEERGVYIDGEGSSHASQHANAFALAFDLVPPERRDSVVAWAHSKGMAVSVYAVQFLLEGYFRAGAEHEAFAILLAGGPRSWKNMMAKGATITWEAWDEEFKPNQDWNHAWATAPINIAARYILGVQPLEPGYGRVAIRPRLGPLSEVKGTVPTIRGPISVHARRNPVTHEIETDVSLPPGVVLITDS